MDYCDRGRDYLWRLPSVVSFNLQRQSRCYQLCNQLTEASYQQAQQGRSDRYFIDSPKKRKNWGRGQQTSAVQLQAVYPT